MFKYVWMIFPIMGVGVWGYCAIKNTIKAINGQDSLEEYTIGFWIFLNMAIFAWSFTDWLM